MKANVLASHLFATFLGVSVSLGCSKRDSDSNDSPKGNQNMEYPAPSKSEVNRLFSSASVSCLNAEGCNPAVGMLVTRSDKAVGVCTAFLIGTDMLVTNSHCVPETLTENSPCKDVMEVRFPAAGAFAASKVGCEKVIVRSNHRDSRYMLNQDYAVIKLSQPVQRKAIEVSRTGVSVGEKLTVISVSPLSTETPIGSIGTQTCTVVGETLATPESNNPLAPVMSVSDCLLVHGNSGSPLLDGAGNVKGIAQGVIEAGPLAMLGELLLEPLGVLGLGTNMACVPTNQNETSFPAECSKMPTEAMVNKYGDGLKLDSTAKWAEEMMQKKIDAWTQDSAESRRIGWGFYRLDSRESNVRFLPVPRCFRALDDWFSQAFKKGPLGYQVSATDSYNTPVWRLKVGLDKLLRKDVRVVEDLATASLAVGYNPQLLYSDARTAVTLTADLLTQGISGLPGTHRTIPSQGLSICEGE